jgi:hypothetical protein
MQLAAENDAAWLRRELAQHRLQGAQAAAAGDEVARLEQVAADYAEHRAALAPLVQARLGLFLDERLRPQFHLDLGKGGERALVCGPPRAGRGLVASVLEALGMVRVPMLLRVDSLTDYRRASEQVVRGIPERFEYPLPLRSALGLLAPGQFSFGRLRRADDVFEAAAGCKLVCLWRDPLDAAISQMRAAARQFDEAGLPGPDWCAAADGPGKLLGFLDLDGQEFFDEYREQAAWLDEVRAMPVVFEELRGELGLHRQRQTVRDLIDWLKLPAPSEGIDEVLRRSAGTAGEAGASRQRQERQTFWDERVEARFAALAGGAPWRSLAACLRTAA